MTAATIKIAAGSNVDFLDVVDLLDWMLFDATLSNTTLTSFRLSGGNTNVTVTGSGFTYGGSGSSSYVAGGTVKGISVIVGGQYQGSITTSINVAQLMSAVQKEDSGSDLYALEKYFLSFNWTYNGSAAADYAPYGTRIGDGWLFNLRGNDTLRMGGGNDVIFAGHGNDYIDGGTGADRMQGGAGNDRYVVDNSGDIVSEKELGSGVDTVLSSISFNLANTSRVFGQVENLTLRGQAAINGTGNNLANVIVGNTGANVLAGAGGNDRLSGAAGNDRLIGGAGNDILIGGAGNDLLIGGAGNDRLNGGAGYDSFVFNAALGASNVDTITDFYAPHDTIRLENAVMPGLGAALGTLAPGKFRANTTGLAQDADDRIIYETDTGKLFYDANGSAAGGAIHVATLSTKPAISYHDFVVI